MTDSTLKFGLQLIKRHRYEDGRHIIECRLKCCLSEGYCGVDGSKELLTTLVVLLF